MGRSLPAFAEASRTMIGVRMEERPPWNTMATPDAIRQFAFCIGDDNPLWLDSRHAETGPYGRLCAPPTFALSVLYPVLHGAAVDFTPTFLISELEFRFHQPILAGDALQPEAILKHVFPGVDRAGREVVYLVTETSYRNASGDLVGSINATLAAIELHPGELLVDRDIQTYTQSELDDIARSLKSETRTGRDGLDPLSLRVGHRLPSRVRGPLTIGDLICWQAAIGPPYRGHRLAYLDLLERPHTATTLPGVGWPVRYSQQHEDGRISPQRGMPAPFDNTTMRAAWIGAMITDWIGDRGVLQRLRVNATSPVLYGDVTRYEGSVSQISHQQSAAILELVLEGRNQLGDVTTVALAQVALPRPSISVSPMDPSHAFRAESSGAVPDATQRCTASELLHAAAMARPSAPAIRGNGKLLRYGELDIRVNQMARALVENGVRPGDLIALCLDRSLEAFILLLATIRSGAAAAPLDSSYPIDPLVQIVEAIKPASIVMGLTALDWPLPERVTTIDYRKLHESAAQQPATPPAIRPALSDPAYVLFTSGSRGVPKPVRIAHGCLGSYLDALSQRIALTSEDTFLHTASLAFSAAVRQLWLPLVRGACLEVADDHSRRSAKRILELIHSNKVSVWDTVPSMLETVLDHIQTIDPSGQSTAVADSLTSICLTGEPLKWQTVRTLQRIIGTHRSIYNLYSQTETGGTVCTFDVASDPSTDSGIVPLGRPLDDVTVTILDPENHPLPPGEPGEIAVSGRRFEAATHPQQQVPSQLIRTGDLGILQSTGHLETLGRADDVIKLRGFRVRLSDIESTLMAHPLVSKVAVIAAQGGHFNTEQRLVAYWTSKTTETATPDDLREFARTRLPDYMVPAVFMELEHLPLTINGKLDRSALPPVSFSDTAQTRVPPQTSAQIKLHALWAEVLGHQDFGVTDDFFAIGGHSLAATRVLSRIESAWGQAIPLTSFFHHSTIAALASELAANQTCGAD